MGVTNLDRVTQRVQLRRALVDLGFRASEAAAAIEAAYGSAIADASLEIMLREALRHCPRPAS